MNLLNSAKTGVVACSLSALVSLKTKFGATPVKPTGPPTRRSGPKRVWKTALTAQTSCNLFARKVRGRLKNHRNQRKLR